MTTEPLGVPRGSVRAVLAILLVGGFVVSCFITLPNNEARTALAGIAGIVSTYYFRSREVENAKDSKQS